MEELQVAPDDATIIDFGPRIPVEWEESIR